MRTCKIRSCAKTQFRSCFSSVECDAYKVHALVRILVAQPPPPNRHGKLFRVRGFGLPPAEGARPGRQPGLVMKSADEFKDKTTAPSQLWRTDFTYLKVIGCGWFYLSTVLDDFLRFIVAWKLSSNHEGRGCHH